MSAVALRCPNCGTTQGAAGECEACHEAVVRFFCANHTPGRWLDGPACDACGARFGVDAPAPRRDAPRRNAPLPPAPGPPVRPAPRPSVRPTARPAEPPVAWPDAAPELEFDLRPGLRAGAAVGTAVRTGVASLVGCFARLVLVALLLLALLAAAFFGLGPSSGVRTWAVDLGQQFGVVGGVPDATTRAIALYRAGERARAEDEFAAAARAYPRSALALLYLARLRVAAGDDYPAGEYLVEAARREPDSPALRRMLREYRCTLAARGRGDAAERVLARAAVAGAVADAGACGDAGPNAGASGIAAPSP